MNKSIIYVKCENFSVLIIEIYKLLIDKKEFVMSKQLLKSSTSIGANVAESRFAQSKKDFISSKVYPVEMVEYMNKNLDMKKVKLYNEYDFGSYLMFKDIKVYIDSRSDLYTKPFNGKFDIFDECMKITNNYGRVFKKYKITHILTYTNTYLNQILAASPNYKLVHKNDGFALYEFTKDNN